VRAKRILLAMLSEIWADSRWILSAATVIPEIWAGFGWILDYFCGFSPDMGGFGNIRADLGGLCGHYSGNLGGSQWKCGNELWWVAIGKIRSPLPRVLWKMSAEGWQRSTLT